MADIELVIKIPEIMYNFVNTKRRNGCFNEFDKFDTYNISKCIRNGTPLPKEHGRLGDLSEVYDKLNEAQIEGAEEYKGLGEAKQIICDAPTIIEADKGE